MSSRGEDLGRIERALETARRILRRFTPGAVPYRLKAAGDPVTEADTAVDAALRELLPRGEEGWLSEETADDRERLRRRRVWIVDPLDGTKQFVAGIPEWAVSVGLLEDGRPVAGGICIPPRDLTVLGSVERGVRANGRPARVRGTTELARAEILASRSEVGRGEWKRFGDAPFRYRPVGSVACKLALVAAGRADATFTLVPKHEWDLAAGAALVVAAGGAVWTPGGGPPTFNCEIPRLPGLFASAAGIAGQLRDYVRGTRG